MGKLYDTRVDRNGEQSAITMVTAWGRESGLVLAQTKVAKKSNEITAVAELLKVLELSGAIVTLDGMGCQTKIVNQIVNQKADYLITLKKNQTGLYKRVDELFKVALTKNENNLISSNYTVGESGHGRREKRHYYVLNNIQELVDSNQKWAKLNSAVRVESEGQLKNGKINQESRYFITSLSENAPELAEYIRGHWGIENQLHWVLDVDFNEDDSRIRKDNAPENLAVMRHIALNLLKQDKLSKSSIKGKRKKAGWDNNYLRELLLC